MVITQNEITEPGGEQHDGEKRTKKIKKVEIGCVVRKDFFFQFPV